MRCFGAVTNALFSAAFIFAAVVALGDDTCKNDLENLHPEQISQPFEIIANTQTGTQMYSAVHKSENTKAGFYRRSHAGWDLLVAGDVMSDERGGPLVTQLALSKTDNKGYVITVVDGYIYILNNGSKVSAPKSIYRVGSSENPLYEIDSMQKRTLGRITDQSEIAIYQDDHLTSLGSQLILVSVKFNPAQAVGEGMTFAFEVLPSNDQAEIILNGKPIVIDYRFQDQKQLRALSTGTDKKMVFSKLLIERLENTSLSSFGEHLESVRDLLSDYVSEVADYMGRGIYLSRNKEVMAYNTTEGEIVRNVAFKKEFVLGYSSADLEQEYFPSTGKSRFRIQNNDTNYLFSGTIDLLSNGAPAAWEADDGQGLILSVNGVLYAIFGEINGRRFNVKVELGKSADIMRLIRGTEKLPDERDLTSYFYLPSTSGLVEQGLLIFSVKKSDGNEGTLAIKLNYLGQKILQTSGNPIMVLNHFISNQELAERTHIDDSREIIFDSVTPKVDSIAAYNQAADQSAPFLNIFKSIDIRKQYKFKKPNSKVEFEKKLVFASFNSQTGIEDPSGLYYNVASDAVTGNESSRVIGQLLLNPSHEIEPDSKPKPADYIFTKTEIDIKSKSEDDDLGESEGKQKLYLFALDAGKKNGEQGFQLVVVASDRDGAYKTYSLTSSIPRALMLSIKNFHYATFVKSRKNQKNNLYLLVAFKTPGDNGRDYTYSFKFNLERLAEPQSTSIEQLAVNPKELEDRLGFDEEGIPLLNLTPGVSSDDYQFSIYDLKAAAKIYPNRDGKTNKRNITFGDYKKISSYDSTYIPANDSWLMKYREDLVKAFPDLGKSAELAQFDSFLELAKKLDAMANTKNEPQRVILVVPATLREMVWDFVLKKGYTGERYTTDQALPTDAKEGPYSYANRDLNISIYSSKKSYQDQFFKNLQSWTKSRKLRPEERNFLLLRLDELQKTGNGLPAPAELTHGFHIRDVTTTSTSDLTTLSTTPQIKLPHGLYLLAAERPMQLKEFKNSPHPASASMLIVATPEEMKSLRTEASSEIENGLLDQFEISEIKDPDQDSMATSMSSVFNNPDIRNLEYKFSAKEIKPRQDLSHEGNFETVIDYAISRFSYLVEQKKESKFESFMRFRSAFANAVLADKEARKTRVIDKYFVERVLTQVFDIPMNLATLPDDDPLKILSRQDALLLLQEAGYSGPFDLKAKVRDTLLSQARADAGKPVPSSIILFGNTGSGKTFMFRALMKMLRLKQYDFNTPTANRDASAIIINMAHISDGATANREGSMTIDQVISNLENFLAQPNGYRGYILIDDVHSAKDAIKARMLSWLRGLFESQDGMYTVKDQTSSQFVRRPVRNLNIFLTLNPTADQDQIAKYARDKARPTPEETLLATLSTSEFKVEPSFLRRFGRIINLDFMPAGAKGPELIKSIAKSSNDLLNTHNRIALVDPKLIQILVANNEKADARSFLSASTSSLIEMAAKDPKSGSLVLVVPKSGYVRQDVPEAMFETNASERISKWVSEHTRVLSLDSGLEGNLAFIEMIADAFRLPVFESFVMALQEDRRLAGDPITQKTLLAPVLAAVYDHLMARGFITVKDLNLNASDFAMKTSSERDYFRSVIVRGANRPIPPLFPSYFKAIDSQVSTWQDVQGAAATEHAFTQKNILSETIQQNFRVLKLRLSENLRVKDAEVLPTAENWISSLPPGTVADPREVGRALVDNLWAYLPRMFDKQIQDDLPDRPPLAVYGATRLFLYALDRAIVQMPWVSTSKFLLNSLEAITEDQVLSQKPGVQSFLFTDPQRLIKPSITDFTFQIIASSHAIEELTPSVRIRMKEEFDARFKEEEKPTK